MIRGHFITTGVRQRPFVDAVFEFPGSDRTFEVPLLFDTCADRTIISPLDTRRLARDLRIKLDSLPLGDPSMGVGGRTQTRTVETILTLDSFSTQLAVAIPEFQQIALPIPSLLGRDVISRFALVVEERMNRVLLLEPAEADALRLPG
jgi:hypothetical protein